MNGLKKILSLALLLCLMSSCKVLEDRELCPCWLSFILDKCYGEFDELQVCGYRSGTLFSDDVLLDEYPSVYEKEVDKGIVRTCVFTGIDRSVREGYRITIPEGEQADKVFLHRNSVICDGEFAYDTVVLHKQWVTVKVTLYIDGEPIVDDIDSYSFEVRSNYNGTDLLDGTSLSGVFRYVPQPDAEGVFTYRLPRHEGNTDVLYMDIYKDGVLVDDMPLGRMLSSNDFNWNEPSLADVDIDVNLSTRDVFITVVPWENLGHDKIEF